VLDAILVASDDAIFEKDLDGTIRSWNPGAERIYGYPAAEIVGQSIHVLIPSDQRPRHDEIMRRVSAGEQVGPQDVVRRTKYGSRADVSLVVSPIRDEQGRVVRALAVGRDLTAQHRIERERRAGDARWRAIVESAVDGIVVIDRRGRIEFFNPAAERLFGFRRAEVLDHNVSMLMPMPYAAEHDHYIKRYQDTREAKIIGIGREVTGLRKDGTTFPMHLSVAEASIEGEVKFVGIIRDLTDRVAMESRLREESGLARIGELAAVLAHEVRNPLAAISGAIQMIGDQLPATSEDREIVSEVLTRINGLSNLMNDLLLYARPPKPQPTSVDLAELAADVRTVFRADPERQGLDIRIEGRADPVEVDPQLLKIALENLLQNAAHATGGTGILTIRFERANGRVHLDVIDRGSGIPADIQGQVFQPFFTTKARGTGLGLATVRRIVESLGGDVRILDSSTEGTIMRVSLQASLTSPVGPLLEP
jgi:PAS domain S-box-containing protein